MAVEALEDRVNLDKLMERLTTLEEQKDELLVKITFLRDLLEKEEEQLKLLRIEEDELACVLTEHSRGYLTEAA